MKKCVLLLIASGLPSAISALGIRYNEGPAPLQEIKYHLYPSRESALHKHSMHKRLHEKNSGEYALSKGQTNCHPLEGGIFVYLVVSWPEIVKEEKYIHPLNSSALYEINIDNSYNATLKEINADGGYPKCMPQQK